MPDMAVPDSNGTMRLAMKTTRSRKTLIVLATSLIVSLLAVFLTSSSAPLSNLSAPTTGETTNLQVANSSKLAAALASSTLSNKTWFPKVTAKTVPRYPIDESHSSAFTQFAETIYNGKADEVSGVYVEKLIALPVIQQPLNDVTFVADLMGTVTQFQSAADHGVIGLLAHNYLSGALFYQLTNGQEVRIVFGDGSYQVYKVKGSYEFQKLEPSNLHSDLVDLSSDRLMTADQVFNQFYNGGPHVTFQTCLEKYGISNWGLTFIVAVPGNP